MKTGKYLLAFLAFAVVLTGCGNETETFDNKLYTLSPTLVNDLLFNVEHAAATRSISVRLAQPADNDVAITFEARPDMAAEYNMVYGDNARALPEKYYVLASQQSLIRKGAIQGDDIVVDFSDLQELNKDFRYVLPVTISQVSGAPVLESARTTYFLFKGAALINVVADISKLKIPIKWSATAQPMMQNMTALTVECLMRSSNWTMNGNPMGLGSLFGREGMFLIRIGDAGYQANQPQIVGSGGGNWPSAGVSPKLPTNEWVHFAFVINCNAGSKRRTIYINGVEAVTDASTSIPNSLSFPSFSSWSGGSTAMSIGYAWEDARYLPCEVSEYRVWNVARTQGDIANNMLMLDPATDGAGLVAYWKFNDGAGGTIIDHSGNGTNLTTEGSNLDGNTKTSPVWNQVQLYSSADF
jgi:hypothetical protein